MPSLEDLAFDAQRDIGVTKAFFPILQRLGNEWAARRPWEGLTVGLNLHLTTLTASLLQELVLGGAQCVVAAANPGTTDPGTVQLLRNAGIEVYTGGDMEDRFQQVLDHEPTLLVDVGFDLLRAALEHSPELVARVVGAVVMSRGGVEALRSGPRLPFPVINAYDGRLKDAVQNRFGIGEAVWEAVTQLTGMHLAGRRVAVVGYGAVGRGLAAWARNTGLAVEVVDTDPVQRLFARYDGYPTPSLTSALSRVHIAVTATGRSQALTAEAAAEGRDGLVLLNAGTGGDEVDVPGLRARADRVDHISDGVVRYRLDNGKVLTVLGNGHPLNIVLNSGSPEPILLHFAVVGLAMEWLVSHRPEQGGEIAVPAPIEARAAELALDAFERP